MIINKLGILIIGVILLQMPNIAFAADGKKTVPPLSNKEIRFKTWDDKAAYEKHLDHNSFWNTKFGHLLPYVVTGDCKAVLEEPQIKFHLSMLLGDRISRLLEIMDDHGKVNLFGSTLVLEGGDRGRESVNIQVNLYDAHVDAAWKSDDGWTIYSMDSKRSWIAGWNDFIFFRKEISEIIDTPPVTEFRFVSRRVAGDYRHLRRYYGTANVGAIVNDPVMRQSLLALLDDKIALFHQNLDVHGNVGLINGWLIFRGAKPFENDTDRAETAIDPQNGQVEVAILSDKIWTVYSSARSWRGLNVELRERIHWDAISKMYYRTPRPHFRFHSWQPKNDHDVDAD